MAEIFSKLFNITLVRFRVGSLREIGLKLRLREAKGALRSVRFLAQALLSYMLGFGLPHEQKRASPRGFRLQHRSFPRAVTCRSRFGSAHDCAVRPGSDFRHHCRILRRGPAGPI